MSQDIANTAIRDQAYELSRDKYNLEKDSIFSDCDFHAGFNNGWDARDIEVKRLRSALERVDLELPIKLTYVKEALAEQVKENK